MTTQKRNEWLDADLDDEDNYPEEDSEVEESKGGTLAGRKSKRRKIDNEDVSADEDEEDDFDARLDNIRPIPPKPAPSVLDPQANQETKPAATQKSTRPSTDLKPLTPKQLAVSQKAISKTGVIYISRVPPFMKPQTVKHLLTPYGEIGRIFLTPEDPAAHTRRVKSGGNKKRSFSDGWVEFLDKKDAKIAAETLNARIIGGKKGGWYHDDVWNIKYLKGFKWHHLTEQIANENAERAARLRTEIAQTTRENKAFIQNVERAKMLQGMEEKRKRKLEHSGGERSTADDSVQHIRPTEDGDKFRRHFKQNEVKVKIAMYKEKVEASDEVKRVLSKIF